MKVLIMTKKHRPGKTENSTERAHLSQVCVACCCVCNERLACIYRGGQDLACNAVCTYQTGMLAIEHAHTHTGMFAILNAAFCSPLGAEGRGTDVMLKHGSSAQVLLTRLPVAAL